MNRIGFILGVACLAMLSGNTTFAEVSVDVVIHSESDFYEPLTPHGEWVVIGSYGRCWRPAHVEADWRPYCNGYWQRTDGGWYWVSDEPWGWATYHYGRWDVDAQFGWFWVPQTVWAPAWVSWHEGGGYIGWAAMSPRGRVDVKVISPRAYVFVEQKHFLQPVRRTTVVVNNTTIINKTVINNGPQVEVVEKASGRKVQQAQVRELRHKEEAAVVIKQRAAPASEKKEKQVQPAVRTEVEPIEKKAAPAPRQVEKPVVTPTVTEAPAPKKVTKDLDAQKPATQQVRPDEESRARQAVKSETKPEVVQPSKHDAKQETKTDGKHEGKPDAKPDGEKHNQKEDKADKESEKKDEGQPTP